MTFLNFPDLLVSVKTKAEVDDTPASMAAKKRQQASSSSANNGSSGQSKRKFEKRSESRHDDPKDAKKTSISYRIFLAILAVIIGYAYRNHIAGMFERDKHFSHLSNLERELAFRTEMGLYYSYYKTMITSRTFMDGLNEIMYDNITEYPLTINVLKRFNLYPEVVLALGFRSYEALFTYLQKPIKQCWQVNRGEGLSPVQSCEGLGEPSYFYVEGVFLLNGIMMAVFFLFGTYLSGSAFGGILAFASFIYNHGECTRVQWTPPLRESFAYPFLVFQMFLVTHVLRIQQPSKKYSILIALATVSFMLPWQFAQFALLTQTLSVFGTYALGFIGSHKAKIIIGGQMAGLLVSYVFLFGNEMLLTSFFASCLLTVSIILLLETILEKLKIRFVILVVQGILLIVGTVGMKFVLSKLFMIEDDAHIGDIFRSKFTDFKNFHTMLYTCAKEFNFMERETPMRVVKTLLAPSVAVAVAGILYKVGVREFRELMNSGQNKAGGDREETEKKVSLKHRSKPFAELVYHVFQLLAFTAMAILIMRLKLFWTPHMCLMTSLLASSDLFGWHGGKEKHLVILALLLGGMSVQGWFNLQHQWSIMGEYSNYPLEEMVEWINHNTPKNAVFAGPMPTMATVKLCTKRPIVNHPHYEDAGLRERTKQVYMTYSRKPLSEIKQAMKDLKVNYLVLEESWCTRRSGPGCSMPEIWDLEDAGNRGKTPACMIMLKNPEPHFKNVFRNNVYNILKVTK